MTQRYRSRGRPVWTGILLVTCVGWAGCSRREPGPRIDSRRVDVTQAARCLSLTTAAARPSSVGSRTEALNILRLEPSYRRLLDLAAYAAEHLPTMASDLVSALTDKTHVGLTGTADLTIPSRVRSGDMAATDHGDRVDDDLFIVAGRANWLLEALTCRTFGPIDLSSDQTRLLSVQREWRRYFAGEDIGKAYR